MMNLYDWLIAPLVDPRVIRRSARYKLIYHVPPFPTETILEYETGLKRHVDTLQYMKAINRLLELYKSRGIVWLSKD